MARRQLRLITPSTFIYIPVKMAFHRGIPPVEIRLVRTSAANGRFWCSETGTRKRAESRKEWITFDSDKLSIFERTQSALADTKTDTKPVKSG